MSGVLDFAGAVIGGAVGFFLGGPVGAAIGAGLGATPIGGKVISSVMNFATQALLGVFGMKIPEIPSTPDTIRGVLVQTTGSDVHVPVVYGYRKVAGTVVYAETGSKDNKYLYVAYVFSEGVVEGLHEIFIDDYQLPATIIPDLNNSGEVTVSGNVINATTGASEACKYNNLVHLVFWSGQYGWVNPTSGNVGPYVKGTIFKEAPSFTADMSFNGLCTIFARYEFPTTSGVTNPFGGSIPTLQISLMGRQVASLVDDDNSNAYSHPENYNIGYTGYTERFSYNPAEILLDYLRNPHYGKGLTNDDIDWDSFKNTAKKCNTLVDYYNGVKGPIHAMSYVVNTGNTIFTNVKDMLTNFRSFLYYSNGKYYLRIEDAGNPTDILSGSAPVGNIFTKDNIQGSITYTGIERSSKYTSYTVHYVDPTDSWSAQSVTYPNTAAERQSYINIDGGRENPGDVTLSGITNPGIAFDLARLYFNKSREQDTLTFTASSEAFALSPGDIIYIQANVLRFGTDPNAGAVPWRIISIKLNNDFTFVLGCVRNPSDIYPHTRTYEKNYNIGIWIPKGVTRTYPAEPIGVPISYWPPGYATRGATVPPAHLPLTNPTNPQVSGGIGDTTSPANGDGNTNTPPPVAIAPPQGNDTAPVFKTTYTLQAGLLYADLYITQPDVVSYASVNIFYKRNIASETNYTQVNNITKPGAGQTIIQRIGPLLNGYQYIVKTQVKYNTNDTAFIVSDVVITANSASTGETPVSYNESPGTGWTPPVGLPTNGANAPFKTITATPVLNAGVPTTPRTLLFTILQDIDTYGQNNYVNGIHIYYKVSAATYWKEVTYPLPPGYIAGVSQPTFSLSDLGIPNYPSTPTSAQLYDFVFSFTYTDGKPSSVYYYVKGATVEKQGTSYTFNAFLTNTTYGTQVFNPGSPGIITTESNAPKGSVTSPLDITVGITGIYTFGTDGGNTARFTLNPPNIANQGNWYGVRVYYRPFSSSALLPLNKVDIVPVTITTTTSFTSTYSFVVPNIQYGTTYEIVVVPLVESSGKKEATNCVYMKGTINFDTTGSNLLFSAPPQALTTAAALNLVTSLPADPNPVASVLAWKRIYSGSTTSPNYKDWYYQLQVQVPTGFNVMYIYRRENDRSSFPSASNFYGLSRWEKIQVSSGTNGNTYSSGIYGQDYYTFDSNNTTTINLRGPVGYTEFDSIYPFTTPQTASRTLYNSLYPDFGGPKPIAVKETTHEFMLVLKVNGSDSIYGLLLPPIPPSNGTGQIIDGLAVNKPTKITVADYNTSDTLYSSATSTYIDMKRQLSDARYPIWDATNLVNGLVYQSVPNVTPKVG